MEWKIVKLGEVCNLLTGFPFKGNLYAKDGIRVLRGENIGDKELHFDGRNDKRWNLPFDKIEQYSLREGDIVMQMDGNVGKNKARLLHDDIPMLIAQRVACLREKEGISDQRYLYFVITGTPFHQYLDSVKTGTSIQHISLKQIGDFELPLPPLETQRRIAAILSSLDDKIENNNRINRNLEAQAQALFKSWFVDFEPWGGIMPEDWKEGTLGEICKIKYGKGLSTNLLTDEGYPVFGGNGVIGYYSKFLYELPQILVSCRGAASGKIMESDPHSFVTSNSLVLEMNDRAYYYYLKYLLLANPLYNYATGSAQPQITIDNIKDVDIVLPSIDIVNTVSEKFEVIDEQIRSLRRENHRLAALRDTLLPKLMKGEVIV